jgi:glycosyltransferase involved in cell wall biosynthesis
VGGAIAFFVAKLLRKKFIYDINGLLAEEYADAGMWKRGTALFGIVSHFEKMVIFHADGIIPLSERIAEKITQGRFLPWRKTRWNVQVIPSHVDMGRFRISVSKDVELQEKYKLKERFVLIYLGSIGTWYMLGEMLDFFKVLKKIIPSALFLIVSHADRDIIRRSACEKDIKERDIIITGALPEDVPRYLSIADAAIFFIKPVFSKEACSPIKLGEYLASGLPVIINSNVGDTEGLIKSTNVGVIVNKFEDEEYERAILEFKNLIDNGTDLKNKCRKAAQEYLSLETALKKYKQLYKDTFKIS